MYSLIDKSNARKAKVAETLTMGNYRHHAAFLTTEPDAGPMLACIKHGTTLVIDNMRFSPATPEWITRKYEGLSLTLMFIEGNRRSYGRHDAADCIKLPDGMVLHFDQLAYGVTARIPRKVRKDKGVAKPRNLIKLMGLDQIRAETDPNPKPEDAPAEQPTEPTPAPVQEPEKEPAPAA
jgi:hypothetical protein